MPARYDIAIVGGGPAGLATAALASEAGMRVVVVEKEPESTLLAPPRDGRDIALTHRSMQILQTLGVWSRFPAGEIAPIRRATVRNLESADLLSLDSGGTGSDALGYLVGNNVIRGALYAKVKECASVDLVTGVGAKAIELGAAHATLTATDGATFESALLVAADSRFSETRRKAGIGAEMRDFGRICIVCRMTHEKEHDATAVEWFDADRTLAVLPLNDRQSSIVLTLPSSAAADVLAMSPAAFADDIERRFRGEWGRMALVGERHTYPLVAVYAHKFHAHRFALVGDAAVGMHPVTAHGFNFGLQGADALVSELRSAHRAGLDIGAESLLESYGWSHRKATHPLYLATNALVGLYTDNSLPAQFARDALLRVGNLIAPVKRFMTHKLTEIDKLSASAR